VLAGVAVWAVSLATRPAPQIRGGNGFTVPLLQVAPGAAAPGLVVRQANSQPGAQPASAEKGPAQVPNKSLSAWARKMAARTDIPVRVLVGYAGAEVALRKQQPDCHLSWTTLAGIGRVESDHGRYGGATVLPSGQESMPIMGVPLDGASGVQAIPAPGTGQANPGGAPAWARAQGPMQFLPDTWAKWGQRANGDGRAPDPQNIDDATLAAAKYLCAGGRNLLTATGWWDAVMSYNNSVSYGQQVFSGADAYARASRA